MYSEISTVVVSKVSTMMGFGTRIVAVFASAESPSNSAFRTSGFELSFRKYWSSPQEILALGPLVLCDSGVNSDTALPRQSEILVKMGASKPEICTTLSELCAKVNRFGESLIV